MIRIGDRPISIMVIYCIVLHWWWAFMIMLDMDAVGVTGVHALYRLIDDPIILAFILVFGACASMMGMLMGRMWAPTLLIPQQCLLLMSAAGAFGAIWLGQYADGVVRPRVFIAADQMYLVIAAIGHTIALIVHVKAYKHGR